MTLYLKYRPQKVSDLDLTSVRESLEKFIKSGRIPHAFLFSGPKGTGKTSAARILAKVVNCENPNKKTKEPCNKCSQCKSITRGENLDIIELDAASHRGIDDVRNLRDAVKLAPAKANKKVYIIDEAHMLTPEASNALLKTLEEPPPHVMFILATTDPQKLITTIRSRATNVNFAKAEDDEIVRSLKKVFRGEALKVDREVPMIISRFSDGSFRDAQKILDQLISEKVRLTKNKVEEHLSGQGKFDVIRFINNLVERDTKNCLQEIELAVKSGVSTKAIGESIVKLLRSALLAKVGIGDEEFPRLNKEEVILMLKLFIKAASDIPTSYIEQVPLEIAVVEWCDDRATVVQEGGGEKGEVDDSVGSKVSGVKRNFSESSSAVNGNNEKREYSSQSNIAGNGISEDEWTRILKELRPRNSSTEALLRAAKPVGFDGKTLKLGVFYSFHKEKLEGNPHKILLEEVAALVKGTNVRVECTLTKPPEKKIIKENSEIERKSKEISIKGKHIPMRDSKEVKSELILTESDDKDIIKVAKEIFETD